MGKPTCKVKIRYGFLSGIDMANERAAKKTMEAVHTDLVQSQTMPHLSGDMEQTHTYVDDEMVNDTISLRTNTDYALRLYFHPEYNFTKTENPYAGGKWLETYKKGDKKDLIPEVYALFLEEELRNL